MSLAELVAERRSVAERLAALDAEIVLALAEQRAAPITQAQDTISIQEWCQRRSYTYSYAVRHWKRLGGFKDQDGRVKFPVARGRAV